MFLTGIILCKYAEYHTTNMTERTLPCYTLTTSLRIKLM